MKNIDLYNFIFFVSDDFFSNLYRSMGDLESSGAFLSTQNGLALSLRARDFIWIASLGVRTLVQPAEADNVTTFGWFCNFLKDIWQFILKKQIFNPSIDPQTSFPDQLGHLESFSVPVHLKEPTSLTPKKSQLEVFVEKLPEAPALMLSFLTDSRSSTRFPAVTRLTVHRRRQLCKIWQFVFISWIFPTYNKLWRICW